MDDLSTYVLGQFQERYHIKKSPSANFDSLHTLKSFFTDSGEEFHGCKAKGILIRTEFGGNLGNKSGNKQNTGRDVTKVLERKLSQD